VLIDERERVLIAQRPAGKELAGGWEFPGGKLEPGEARAQGLARELKEEIGVAIRHPRPLLRLRHEYSYGEILLDVWVVRRYHGRVRALDGQALRWLPRAQLASAELLPADRPIVAALHLPQRLRQRRAPHYRVGNLRVLEERAEAGSRLCGVECGSAAESAAAAEKGADFLVLRGVLDEEELKTLCEGVAVPVYARGLTPERAWGLGASGINAIT